ncbi:MAG: acetylglutamate kinase [Thermodesulfobacteriota bacterium]|nr:acetylglutamate kinase [Thermodesulfobacteriota bacterium]
MNKGLDRARILIEALPYIREFNNKIMVIKYGGHAMVDSDLKRDFALDIILMKYVGLNPVVVHGGGPQIGEYLDKMAIKSNFIDGHRITDETTMDIVEMVLAGKVNKEIVATINQNGGQAVGLSGKDGHLITARKLKLVSNAHKKFDSADNPPEIIDIGMVGEVVSVDNRVLKSLMDNQFIPVIAPVGVGKKNETYNINADLVAGHIASSLKAMKLILLTDVEGVMDRHGNLIASLTVEEVRNMIDNGDITGGMIPKLQCCLEALENGVEKAHIINGTKEHALLLEIFTDEGVGTEVVPGQH